ncbi:MAG: DUF4870 family protein [Betaproteobacteria bacterium]
MSPPEFTPIRSSGDRMLMHVLYGLHTLAWFSMGTLAVVALLLNYIRRGDEVDAIYLAHHRYMISTFWWTLLWLLLFAPLWLLLVFPGWLAYLAVLLWYLYRCLKGWLRFNAGRPPVDPSLESLSST